MNNKDEQGRNVGVNKAIIKAKTEVLSEFEKICPSDRSFDRMKKNMHDIFDQMLEEIKASL